MDKFVIVELLYFLVRYIIITTNMLLGAYFAFRLEVEYVALTTLIGALICSVG